MSNSSIRLIDRTLSGATTPGQSGSGSDGNKGVFHISQCYSITRNSPSELFSVINKTFVGGVKSLCRDIVEWILQPQSTTEQFYVGNFCYILLKTKPFELPGRQFLKYTDCVLCRGVRAFPLAKRLSWV